MILSGKQYDETDPRAIWEAAVDIANHMVDSMDTASWTKCLYDSSRNMRRLATAMDKMRENTTYVEHNP